MKTPKAKISTLLRTKQAKKKSLNHKRSTIYPSYKGLRDL